jgi:hypothetical protein
MGKPVSSNVPRAETTPLNTKVNKEVFEAFKDCCSELGYPMNVLLETFMRQYTSGKFKLSEDDILKFKNDGKEVDSLNTTFNKKIYTEFKSTCKGNGFFLKHVITAFMEKFASGNFVLEYVSVEEVKKK